MPENFCSMLYYRIVDGKRVYTLDPADAESAAPARYSVGDKFSQERIAMKMRYKIFPFDE